MAFDLRIGGLLSGIDTRGLIDAIMEKERIPVNSLLREKEALQVKKDAWRDVNTRLANLLNRLSDLRLSATFKGNTATSTDEKKVTASATSGASAGTHMLEITQIAQAHTVASDRSGAANADTYLNLTGTFRINGKDVTVTTSDSLNSIKKKINDAQAGVTASVVDNRLVIRNNEMGAGKLITFSDDPGTQVLSQLGILTAEGAIKNTVAAAQNAIFSVDGLVIERDTNSVSDVIDGVTLNLKDQTTEKVQITITDDTQKTVNAIKAFVDQYNSVMSFIAEKRSYDATTKKTGVLFGDSSLIQLENSLRQLISASVGGLDPGFRNLAAIGINTSGKAATLTVNEAKLIEKLKEDPDKVAALFGAAKTNVAYSGTGAVVIASSQQAGYAAASAIDGNTSSENWGINGGWMDNTPGTFPDYLEVVFGSSRTIDEIKIFTLDAADLPADTYGIRDFTLEYWKDGAWQTLEKFYGNTKGLIDYTFDPITTDRIRLKVDASNGANDYSRVVEIQAFQQNDGLAARMYDTVFSWTRSGTGVLAGKDKAFDTEIKGINDKLAVWDERLARREEALWAQFNAMEQAISKLNSQSIMLTQFAESMKSSRK